MSRRTLATVLWLLPAIPFACDGTPPGGPGDIDGREPFAGAWSPTGEIGERIIYLRYADGGEVTTPEGVCAGRRPPAYRCAFAPSRGACQAAIQAHLERWYRAFPVHFTLVRPPESVPHDTVVVTADGQWCGSAAAGLAPATCSPLASGTVWAFSCGDSAEQCAAIIAQEQAHLLGLEHTASPRDIMFTPLCRDCAGFEDRESQVIAGRCRRVQNSFSLMKEHLGERAQSPTPQLSK